MYEEELERIRYASNNNSLTFFVGAGVSRLSGAPGWKGLIDDICDIMGVEKKTEYSSEEYLKIPQMYYYSLDDEELFYKTIESKINKNGLKHNVIHREMLSLNPVSFITTNYDTLLEDAAADYCQTYRVVSRDNEVPTISGERFILKIHGDFRNKNIVLKEEDYLNYSENFKLIETLVKSIFCTNMVVFIGYGLGDYNIKLILNWAKSLLKEDFKKPVFLYIDDDDLSKEELIYQESKGLSVVDYKKIRGNSYPNCLKWKRYQEFFLEIKRNITFDGNAYDLESAFKRLYSLLKPLDNLKALRQEDVSGRLSDKDLFIESSGVIRVLRGICIFDRFIEIDKMDDSDRSGLESETLAAYELIKRVLGKACIFGIYNGRELYEIKHPNMSFADSNCIMFDYKRMDAFVKKQYRSLSRRFTKAFYLYKLYRYDEALRSFEDISRDAFSKKEYLWYYFAEVNCNDLRILIKRQIHFYHGFDKSLIEEATPDAFFIDNLFSKLPFEFRNSYDSLKDIHSTTLLYKYAYNAFEAANKVDEVIKTNTVEYGVTSSSKAIHWINDYLHFFQGNCLVNDAFREYRIAVKRIMEAIVHRYSTQDKHEVLVEHIMPENREEIVFDEIDFHCFIEYFTDRELNRLFVRYSVSDITFRDVEIIERIVRNLIDSYVMLQEKDDAYIFLLNLQDKIKNALVLLRYVDISQELVEYICEFLLFNEFRDIPINDKVSFIDSQIYVRGKRSPITSRIIEKVLLSYIDRHMNAVENGTEFNVQSYVAGITYSNLANYISPSDNLYVSQKLSNRVGKMIKNDYEELFSPNYFDYITKTQQRKVISWINLKLETGFSIELFSILMYNKCSLNSKVKSQLLSFLRKERDVKKTEVDVIVYPRRKPFENIIQAGYWCLLGLIDPIDLKEFEGVSDEFDFYYQYELFDYSKFDAKWLLWPGNKVLERISTNKGVAAQIRGAIAKSVMTNNLSKHDNERLQRILINYFC